MSVPAPLLNQIFDEGIDEAYSAQQRMLNQLGWPRTAVQTNIDKRSSLHAWLREVEHTHDEIRASILMHGKGDIDTLMLVCEDKSLYFYTIPVLFDHPHDPDEFSDHADDSVSIDDTDDHGVDFVITTGDPNTWASMMHKPRAFLCRP